MTITPELARIEKALNEPLDVEREAWLVSRTGFRAVTADGRRRVIPIHRDPYRASFLSGTNTELIYSNPLVGTAKNTFTAEAVINDVAGMGPQPILPPYFFLPSRGRGTAVRIVARGVYSTTAAPTWQFFTRLGGAASVAGPNIGSTTALTALGSGQTNLLWEFEMEAQLTLEGGTGANSTTRGLGLFTAAMTASTSIALAIFGGAASPGTVATVDISATNFVNFSAACGTSSASNAVTVLQLLVFGLN